MPSAKLNSEGYISFNYSSFYPYQQYRFNFSPYDSVEASLFYTDINSYRYDFSVLNQSYKDKGFAFRWRLPKFLKSMPDTVIGFEDFAGTGITSSEFIASTINLKQTDVTLGLGWGRLGSKDTIKNPFSILSKKFKNRAGGYSKVGGIPEYKKFFRGDAALFFGVEHHYNDLSFKAEYDSIDYSSQFGYFDECKFCPHPGKSRWNYGINYQINEHSNLGIYFIQGNKLAFNFSLGNDFSSSSVVELKNINGNKNQNLYLRLLNELKKQDILIQSIDYSNDQLSVSYIQLHANNEAQVSKEIYFKLRKIMGENTKISLIPINSRFTLSTHTYDNYYRKINKTDLRSLDAFAFKPTVIFPALDYSIGPSYKTHIGSPSGFIFGELNITTSASAVLSPSLEFDLVHTIPMTNNYENLDYDPSRTDLEPVRTDIQDYLKKGLNGFEVLALTYFKQYTASDFLLISLGDFETMYGGIYAEYLKRSFKLPISYGISGAVVKKRDFSKDLFSYQDYEVFTGHFTLYVNEPKYDLDLKVSYGRYLAKDDGFTFDLSRNFQNGLRIGAFFSLTNITADQFGEGSFDKGIYVNLPLHLFSRGSKKGTSYQSYRPLLRDGAAKLNFHKDLYSLTKYSSLMDF